MQSCLRCLKVLVTFFNCLVMTLGIAIEAMMVWVYVNMKVISDAPSPSTYIIYFFMALGALMTIMGFLGCCGALQESQCMLGTFFTFVLLLFVGQIGVCIWSYANIKEIERGFQISLKDLMTEYYYRETSIQLTIDAMQREFECCGASGPSDWRPLDFASDDKPDSERNKSIIPSSCCRVYEIDKCREEIYDEGCSDKLFDWLRQHRVYLLCLVVVVSVIEIFALIFSLLLCITFGKMEQYYTY